MKKFFKVVGIVFLVLLIGFMGLGFFMGDLMEDMLQEVQVKAEKFASSATKDDCLTKYIGDYKSCTDMSCYSEVSMFGVICLSAASGDKVQFCADKPKSRSEFYTGQWKEEFCEKNGLDTQSCLSVYKLVETHCSS